ncbi:MAG: glycogen debranching protein GlgX [Ectothiorhodospiraceae bacterium]|nr:glycogen debranching protein GlgX [Chromatiales bacterium]MCP5156439.1 glycogen debranching protein GlgX [Ectothiorhodospiraceae bacterium]
MDAPTTSHPPVEITAGAPAPLGACCDGEGVNFALRSAHAERVELCLFEPGATREHRRLALPARTGDVWHGHVPGLRAGQLYGFRVHGPWAPRDGHRFNPHKLLVDPHARALAGHLHWSEACYAFRRDHPEADLSFDEHDSAPFVPRAVVVHSDFDWGGVRRPDVPWRDTVIYEAHVRGLTRLHPDVPEALRGTFEGLAHPRVIAHLLDLGVTTLELMPVHAFVDDPFLVEQGLRNYWGYSTLGFFAPEPRYLGRRHPDAFKRMVRALHAAGIEVILDVVYNHTAEGNRLGPTLSLRGIDNASYYRLDPDSPRDYVDYTGCGNSLDLGRAPARALVLDSLRYWAEEMQVDGFRFDLATTLARGAVDFDVDAPFLREVAADPVLSTRKLIAEPWDVGPQGYRLGGFPPGWAEWNDRFRDTTRRFWRGDAGVLPEFARRVHGSGDLFDHPGRGPWASVNFVASHDGFTVADVARYHERHNAANGEDNRDGHHANWSDNHGVEGPSDDPTIEAARLCHQRNLLATTLLAHGTPMLLAGDEMGRSQHGNNNAYCQDNETSWLDWSRREHPLLDLVRALTALRRAHPVLRRPRYAHGAVRLAEGEALDVEWLREDASPMVEGDWHDPGRRTLAMLLGEPTATGEDVVLLAFNAGPTPARFVLPARRALGPWRAVLSTADSLPAADDAVVVAPRSLVVLEPTGE